MDALENWEVDHATTADYATTANYSQLNGVEYIVGSQTTATGLWKGVTTSEDLYVGKVIAYKLPYAGTSTSATLDLTLPNGSQTGAKNIYCNASRITTWYPANTVIMLTYDGTGWRTNDSNTTYSAMSVAEMRNGTATTGRTMRSDYLKTFLSTLGGSGLTFTQSSTGIILDHTNSITADTISGSSGNLGFGDSIIIPAITYDSEGHITGTTSTTVTLPASDNTDTKVTQAKDTTAATAYPIILAYTATSNAVTNTVNKSSNFTYNPDSKTLTINNGNVIASSFTGHLVGTADNAINAGNADYATTAGNADYANTANNATLAGQAEGFSSNKSVTLTGDVTGTAASTAGWSIATTLASVTTTTSTSTSAPNPTDTFTVIDSINVDTKGRVTGYNVKTVTMPADSDTKYSAGAGLTLTGTTFSIPNSSVTNAMLAGSIANNKLANSSMTIAGNTVSLGGTLNADTLRTSLGLSSALHFLGKATVSLSDGSTDDPKINGNTTTVTAGDVVIDSNSSYEYIWDGTKWERLGPDGSYVISGSTIIYTPAGTIPAHSYQPAGSISAPSFTGDATTISMSGNTTGIKVEAHSYTPAGTIASTATSTGANYTPSGIISQPEFTGTSATVKVNGTPNGNVAIVSSANANGNYTPSGTIQSIGFTGTTATISVSGTPQGSVAISTATATSGTNYTPQGNNAASNVTITPSTTTVYSMSSNGSVTAGSSASFQQGTDSFTANTPTIIDTTKFSGGSYSHSGFSGGSQASASMVVTDAVLTFSFTPNNTAVYGTDSFTGASIQTGFYTAGTSASFTQGTDSFTANTPTLVTLPSRTSATVWNGYTAATAAAQTFTGVATKISAEFSGSTSTATCKYQPAGTVTTPEFYGTKVQLDATFTGTSTTFSGSFKPSGTVSQPIFSGDSAKFTFSGSAATLSHTVTQGSVSLSTQYQPTGTVSAPTFTGTTATLSHTFNGTTATITLP